MDEIARIKHYTIHLNDKIFHNIDKKDLKGTAWWIGHVYLLIGGHLLLHLRTPLT